MNLLNRVNNNRQTSKSIRPMKDRKTKQIQKDRYIRKPYQRPREQAPFIHRKKQHHEIKNIDRSQICPFLVRIFYAINDQNHYKGKPINQIPIDRQIKLHLWMNSTLKEITQLVRAILPNVRTKQKFVFWRLTYSKDKKQFQKEELGWIYPSKRYDKAEERTLGHTKFKIGDMIDLSITYK